MKSASGGAEGFQAEADAGVGDGGPGAAERIDGVVGRPFPRRPGGDAALGRRAEDEHVAAEVGAAAGQFAEVIGGGLADGLVRRGEPQPLGAGEQPVQPQERQAAVLGLAAQLTAALRGHVGDAAGEGERRDFQTLVAEAGDEPADAPMVPALERLIADRITHEKVPEESEPPRRQERKYPRTSNELFLALLASWRFAFYFGSIVTWSSRPSGLSTLSSTGPSALAIAS